MVKLARTLQNLDKDLIWDIVFQQLAKRFSIDMFNGLFRLHNASTSDSYDLFPEIWCNLNLAPIKSILKGHIRLFKRKYII